MTVNTYDVGDAPTITARFTNGGALQNPGGPRFIFKAPGDNAPTTWTYPANTEIVRDSTGIFHVVMLLDEPGTWLYRWEGDAPVPAAYENYLRAKPSGLV